MESQKRVIIVGAGPAGLFAAGLLLEKGFTVDLYDHSSGAAKKFLIAGNGGLNLTHSEDHEKFVTRYWKDAKRFEKLIHDFSPQDLRDWLLELGTETFVGSSGRVFPKEMSAGKVLLNWLEKLKGHDGFHLHLKHKLIKVTSQKQLVFDYQGEEISVQCDTIILALGGGSWKKTGSDGNWVSLMKNIGIEVNPLLPMNCGFEKNWSEILKNIVDRKAIKNVEVSFANYKAKGDLMITPYGVEGGVIYALSNHIREEVLKTGSAKLWVDLRPGLSLEKLTKKIERKSNKTSLSNHLRKRLNFDKEIFTLLKEVLEDSDLNDLNNLAKMIKTLPIEVTGIRPIDEAISTSGGVCFSQLSIGLEVKSIPGIYFAGEMLDFEAPTGGYLLQGCFSTAYAVVKDIINE